MAGDDVRERGEDALRDDLRDDLLSAPEAPREDRTDERATGDREPDPLSDDSYEPDDALDGALPPDVDLAPATPAVPAPPVSSLPATTGGEAEIPSAQHFQDVIALRREAEEAAAAALEERRQATSQASRIVEEALRAAEALHADARRSLDEQRTAAETEAATILERARAEAAEIIKAGENDVLEAQRLRREAGAERDRLNAELERIRRTAQEELFAEANRHAARMDEIRTRVLHGVEAATDSLRESGARAGAYDAPRVEPATPSFIAPPPAEPAPVLAAPVAGLSATVSTPEPESAEGLVPGFAVPAPQAPAAPAAPTAPNAAPVAPGIPANAPITPYTPSGATPTPSALDTPDDPPNRGKRGWRSRR